MATKKKTQTTTKKAPKSAEGRMYGDGAPVSKTTTTTPTATRPTGTGAATGARPLATGGRGTIPLEQQYAYVMSDIKRLSIVALGMFAFLIVLGFILR